MKISVIIPTFNRAEHLPKAIRSVLDQTIKADEIIVVDDGSNDNTKNILQDYPIKYFYQKNKGVSSARNKGIELAANDWICFLDSDDIWECNKLEKQITFHKQNHDILFSYTDETWLFNGKTIKQKAHQQKKDKTTFTTHLPNTFIGTSTVMLNKSILDTIGNFDTNLIACEDYDLWLRILLKHQVGYIDDKLIQKIAGHEGQLSFETPLQDKYRIQALLKHINSPYKDEVINELIKKCNILIKGAVKHNNQKIQNYYQELKDTLT